MQKYLQKGFSVLYLCFPNTQKRLCKREVCKPCGAVDSRTVREPRGLQTFFFACKECRYKRREGCRIRLITGR